MRRIVSILLLSAGTAAAQSERFYLGTYTENGLSRGIYTGTIDVESGQVSALELAATVASPNYLVLSPDQKSLYACTPTNGGSVSAFRVEAGGKLTFLNQSAAGKECCHVNVDATGKSVFAANYFADSITGYTTKPDGSIAEKTAEQKFSGYGPNRERQDRPHLHSVYVDAANKHLLACDLGTDNIWMFDLDAASGKLQPMNPPAVKVPAGSGPRHLAFGRRGHFFYVNGEMGMNVSVFSYGSEMGAVKCLQTISTLPPGADTNGMATAEIVSPKPGGYVYVSNRDVTQQGRDSLTVLAVGSDGTLSLVQNTPALVKIPRGFGIDPAGKWLLAGGQADNRLSVFKIDGATGRLTPTGQIVQVGSPVCVTFEAAETQ